jgi:Peptidase family M23
MIRVRCSTLTAGLAATVVILLAGLDGGPALAASVCERAQKACSSDETEDNRPAVLAPVVWSVVGPPVHPVKGTDGRIHLAYEILFTNVVADALRLLSVEMIDPDEDDAPVGEDSVFAIDNTDVTSQLRIFSAPATLGGDAYSRLLGPGQSGLMFVDLTFEDRRDIPRRLAHRVTVSQDVDGQPQFTAVGGLAKVSRAEAVVVKPPLRGDRWVDWGGCCSTIAAHRFALLPLNGSIWPAQRFAIDFVQLDEEGRLFEGDLKNLDNWHFFGADVLAAASGRVIEVVNDLPNQVPGALPPRITIDEGSGNRVIMDIGDGRFALYAHMIPGSIVVEEGQRVRAGEKLGRLGNSGNTDAPHLHFQIMDGPGDLNSVGLPFVFDRMALQGRLTGSSPAAIDDLLFAGEALPVDDSVTGPRRRQMPLALDLLGFR